MDITRHMLRARPRAPMTVPDTVPETARDNEESSP